MLHLGPIWYHSEPSDVPYSQTALCILRADEICRTRAVALDFFRQIVKSRRKWLTYIFLFLTLQAFLSIPI